MTVEYAETDTAKDGRNGQAAEFAQSQPAVGPNKMHREGAVARGIERHTAKMPSDYWMWAAFASMGLSVAFKISGQEKHANFVGLWAPTLLIFGVYNKIVKLQGSDGV